MRRTRTLVFGGLLALALLQGGLALLRPRGCPPCPVRDSAVVAGREGLAYRDDRPGTGPVVRRQDRVAMRFALWLPDGRLVDCTYEAEDPLVFTLGSEQVIRGVDLGVEGMKVGGRRALWIPAALAYEGDGAGAIPPDTEVTMLVDLVGTGLPEEGPLPSRASKRTGDEWREPEPAREEPPTKEHDRTGTSPL